MEGEPHWGMELMLSPSIQATALQAHQSGDASDYEAFATCVDSSNITGLVLLGAWRLVNNFVGLGQSSKLVGARLNRQCSSALGASSTTSSASANRASSLTLGSPRCAPRRLAPRQQLRRPRPIEQARWRSALLVVLLGAWRLVNNFVGLGQSSKLVGARLASLWARPDSNRRLPRCKRGALAN